MAKVNVKLKLTKRWSFYPIGLICYIFKVKMPVRWMLKIEVDRGNKLNA